MEWTVAQNCDEPTQTQFALQNETFLNKTWHERMEPYMDC